MSGFLLDANVLIALVTTEHEHHTRAGEWFVRHEQVVMCPIAEGALVRYLLRIGESVGTAQAVVGAWRADGRVGFVADDLSYAHADLGAIHGHRQATDAYLVALAARHHLALATLDEGLARTFPEVVLLPD